MKKLKRTFLSLVAITVLLLMNPGFLAIQVYAWDNWTSKPSWNDPTWSQPGWTTPPEWQDPTWKTPQEWQDPSWRTAPEWNDSTWKDANEWNNTPQWNNSPWQTKPEWNNNSSGNPGQNEPGVNPTNPTTSRDGTNNPNPDGTLPGPPYNPDYTNPGLEQLEQIDQTINQPSAGDTETASGDEPFINFGKMDPKDAISFAVKDVIGGTANLTVQALNENKELTLQDFLKNRGSIYAAGFKGLTKGDETIQYLFDGSDSVSKIKDIHNGINTFQGFKAIRDLEAAGDLLGAAAKYDELLQAGRTFTPGNAVVSAIAMPFTIMETVENVGKFNAAKTSEEKFDAGADLVGNAGGIISGAALGVGLIPGAQPIAAGMLVVGGVLSLASLGYKLIRNREKVVKDVKEKFNKAKEKVTGFFKSVFGG
ncbi:hypothetical protein ACVBAX_20925 [Robertmurraya sp. GLU-23]